jgi:hypothetical protein
LVPPLPKLGAGSVAGGAPGWPAGRRSLELKAPVEQPASHAAAAMAIARRDHAARAIGGRPSQGMHRFLHGTYGRSPAHWADHRQTAASHENMPPEPWQLQIGGDHLT